MADWQKVREVFDTALRQESTEREGFIKEACGENKDLLREVQSLISSLAKSDNFLEAPVFVHVADIIECDTRSLEKGTRFGHYEIIKQIGSGGMGEVYLAQDLKLGRRIAIKTLNEEFREDGSSLIRFVGEAKAASALNHPNILVIHEIGESEDAHYIVSEFIEGRTLREICSQSQMSLGEVLDVSIQIADALSVAHGASLVHRDIKPENVMVRPDGYVKVLDFGLAKLVEQRNKPVLGFDAVTVRQNRTGKGLILGTVNYMSPEQAKGEELDERTDIFSTGTLIYEMIGGKTPFVGDSMAETFANLITAEPEPLSRLASNVPAELQRIVYKTLQKNRNKRYQTMKGLLADLKRLRESLTFDQLERSHFPRNYSSKTSRATTEGATLQTAATSRGFSPHIEQHKLLAAFAVVVFLASGILLPLWYERTKHNELAAPILSAPFTSEKLSNNGKIVHAVVSSDGKNVVYTNGIKGKQGVWLRQLESANNVELIPPSDVVYGGLALSPDDKFLYFHRRSKSLEQNGIYRVSIAGGIPTPVINDVEGWMSFSADGEKISFVRCEHRREENCALWIADAWDGKHARKLVSRPSPFRIADNKISPDGKWVAFAVGQSENSTNAFGLVEVNIESGAERELTAQKFFNIKRLTWLPNQSGLLFTAALLPDRTVRIWQLSTVTSEASPVTKNSVNYLALSLNKDASVMVCTETKEDFRLRLLTTENPAADRVVVDATKVTFAPDSRLIFASTMLGSNREIWSVNADGSGQRQLTTDAADDSVPVSSPDNNLIFFFSNRTGEAHVWQMNADGSNQIQITRKEGGYPLLVSPDGYWLYYIHSLRRNIWRVPVKGGDEQLVLDQRKNYIALSPDGLQAAFSEEQGEATILMIVSLTDGRVIKTLRFAESKGHVTHIAWLPDGKKLAYIVTNNEYENSTLWRQPLNGEKAQQITALGNEQIRSFAVAPDGRSFAIAQGGWRHDAVLLRGLK